MEKVKISAIVLTYNEEKNIRRCLESLQWVDEIIIVDSFSTDRTIEICSAYSTKIFYRKFDDFASQRNFALSKASNEWVLIIDADEEVSFELMEEIKRVINRKEEVDGYYILRENFWFGKHLRYGTNAGDYSLRLFRRDKVIYTKGIHEVPVIDGKLRHLKGRIIHHSYTTLSQYLFKLNLYTDLESKEMAKKKAKISCSRFIFLPVLRFFWVYIVKSGWKDGMIGFLASLCGSVYMLTKYWKYVEFLRIKKYANWD
jgi:glycosyltransferase involved in cell wall biosynthesis